MKQIIDIETWERKENFNFFRRFQNPQLSITSEVECGGAKKRAKEAHQSFFLHYLYAVLRAANEIPELRYRIDPEGRVVLYDQIDILSPIKIKENGKFFTIRFPYHEDFETFYQEARKIIDSIPENGDPYAAENGEVANGDDSIKRNSRFIFYFNHWDTGKTKRQQLSATECWESNHQKRQISNAYRHDYSSRICRRASPFIVLQESGGVTKIKGEIIISP